MNKNAILFFILILFFSTPVSAEVARIKDKDGFTNVRSGKGVEFPVIATLDTTDLFYCDRSNGEWIKIRPVNGLDGYIHRSRIEFLEDIDNAKKKELLENTFATYEKLTKYDSKLNNEANKSKKQEDYDKANKAMWEKSGFGDSRYSPVLEILPLYFHQTKDTATLQLLFNIMWMDRMSANEIPSYIIGQCFRYEPELILEQIQLLKNKEQRTKLFDDIEHGLEMYFDIQNEKEQKEWNNLLTKLNDAQKK